MRIAVASIGHETNTFSTLRTRLDDFRIQRGDEILQGEFWDRHRRTGVEWAPALMARAMPHGLVEKSTYLQLKDELLERLDRSLPVDGVYLGLHGAMEVETIGDGESDLVGEVRKRVGENALISVSLDLHGNIAPAVVGAADVLTAYRTAPHRDGEATRERAVSHLVRCLREDIRPVAAMVKLPLLLPGEFAVTEAEPARSLYEMVREIDALPGILDASLLIGCAWTDGPYTSTSAIVVAERDGNLAHEQAARLAGAVWAQREAFAPEVETLPTDDAVAAALAAPERPVFLSDSGDNVTAGGAGDIPLLAERLLTVGASNAVVAGIADSDAVSQCAKAGRGARVTLKIGGKLDRLNAQPLNVTGEVVHLHPAARPTLATVRVAGVDIILTAGRQAFPTLESIRAAGVNPLARKIVVVKMGLLMPDLRDGAPRAIMALTPGFTDLRMSDLPFKRLRRPIFPLDRDVTWQASARQ